MTTKIFVNLAVKDLEKSKKFYTGLGYTVNLQFTDKNAACIIVSEEIHVMLLAEAFFQTFTKKHLVKTKDNIEVINALTTESREKVDEMAAKVEKAGGKVLKTYDHGWMYNKSFEDLDGHAWEIFYMDISQFKK